MKTLIKVSQLLESKGYDVVSVASDISVREALKVMARENIGSLLVLEEERPVGMMTERDYARKIVLQGKFSWNTEVRDIMSPLLAAVSCEDSVEHCMQLMTERRVRHLPVMEEQEVIGVISIGDVVKVLLSEQEFMIDQLERFIKG